MTDLPEHRVALVTGAASGIGRATAIRLADGGAAVVGVDIDEAALADTAAHINDRGGRMQTQRCDVTSRVDCESAVETAVGALGRLDVLVNSAGVNRFARFTDITDDQWNRILGVNLTGCFLCCQAAIPQLLETGGNVVNIASVSGLMGQAYTVPYSVSKSGVIQLTRSLAMEYAKTRLRVNAVAPGGVDTPMNVDLDIAEDMDWSLIERYVGFRGLARPEEIAEIVVFVASDQARWLHGSVVSCDGGVSAG